jgi:parallel beta-helix repeat protein
LRKTDPVVSTGPSDVCEERGLTVTGSSVILDCDKLTLRGASVGVGVGLDNEGGIFITVKNCTIREFGAGIDDDTNGGTIIESNTIIENVGPGIFLDSPGFITVRKNKVTNNGGNGIWCDDTCHSVVYEKNRIIGNAGHGLETSDSSDNQILGNAVQGAWGSG